MIPRLKRLFADDGRCFDVAVDHGFFGERTFLTGIENMAAVVDALVAAAPDAIQLSPGQAMLLQRIAGPRKPALVLRTDVVNVYGPTLPSHLFSQLIDDPVGKAVALDAACVVVNLLLLPDQPELLHQCIRNVVELRAACDRAGMPLMVEPLAMSPGPSGYGVDGNVEKIAPLVRQAVELGADVVKADPTDDLADYGRVIVAATGRPVLPRGGGRAPIREVLSRTAELMRQGAAGIVYGRNVVQHDDPVAITDALMSIVHGRATEEEALERLEGAS